MAENIGYLLIRLGRLLERRLQCQLGGGPLGASQLMTLAYIAHTPGINRAALARELAISPQATGNLAAQLQADGLITRTRHQPGQPTLHQVTPHGTRTLAAAAPTVQDVGRDLAKRLSPAHRHLLAQLVSHLLTTYTDI